jgi:hypothetical protein
MLEDLRRQLDAMVPAQVNGGTPEGFDHLCQYTYEVGSLQVEEVRPHEELELHHVTVSFKVKVVTLTSEQGFTPTIVEGFAEAAIQFEEPEHLKRFGFLHAITGS